jgi:ElaB/YqjD/DUF883 family membrane-anchored ribosome-binding protein
MPRRSRVVGSSYDMAAIKELMDELEKRLRRLNSAAKQEASGVTGDVNQFVNQALSDIADRLREGTQSLTNSVTEEATRIGGDALKRIGSEIERHPLATVTLAAGVGFLVGLAGQRPDAARP